MTGLYVDLGYGAYPITSVETLHRLRRLNPTLRADPSALPSVAKQAFSPRQIFTQSALRLADRYGYPVDRRPALRRRGFVWLGPGWPASCPAGD